MKEPRREGGKKCSPPTLVNEPQYPKVLRSQVSNLKLLSSHNMAYMLHPPWGHLAEWLGEGKSQRNLRHIAFFKVTKMTNLDSILKGRDIN